MVLPGLKWLTISAYLLSGGKFRIRFWGIEHSSKPISSHLSKSIEVLDEGPLAVDEYDTADAESASSGGRE